MYKYQLTIVIVNWNTKTLTSECLRSIFENYHSKDWNVVVVDNASSDGSVELISSLFPQVELVKNTQNRGFAAANNQVLSRRDSKFYLLLNSDTYVIGDAIKSSLDFINAKSEVGAFSCKVLNEDMTYQQTCFNYPTISSRLHDAFKFRNVFGKKHVSKEMLDNWDRNSEREVEVITGCYLLVSQEVIDDVGILDEDFFFFGEETDWCFRIKSKGWKLVFSPVGEIVHYGGGSAKKLQHKRELMLHSSIVRFMKKHHGFLSAIAMYVIMFMFVLTRFFYWSFLYLVKNKKQNRDKASFFLKCITGYVAAWPRNNRSW